MRIRRAFPRAFKRLQIWFWASVGHHLCRAFGHRWKADSSIRVEPWSSRTKNFSCWICGAARVSYWVGEIREGWSVTANWTNAAKPTSLDVVVFDASGWKTP